MINKKIEYPTYKEKYSNTTNKLLNLVNQKNIFQRNISPKKLIQEIIEV